MRLRIVACEIFFRELCHLAARSRNKVDVEFLPKGLHDQGGSVMRGRVQAAVAAPGWGDLRRESEVAVLAGGEKDAAVAGPVLGGEDDAVLHAPALAVAVVVRLADVPAGEVLPVEERREAGGNRGEEKGSEGGEGEET